MEIHTRTCMEAWSEAIRSVRTLGDRFTDDDGNACAELLNLSITIDDTRTTHEPLRVMIKRKTWHYPSAEELERMVSDPKSGSFAYTYGSRIHNYDERKDQFREYLIPLLQSRPQSRRAVLTIWNPMIDAEIGRSAAPGHISIDFKLRSGKLHVTSTMRSADLFFGYPANVFQVSVLQREACKALGVKPGRITMFCTSAHVFEYQFGDIDSVMDEISREQTHPDG